MIFIERVLSNNFIQWVRTILGIYKRRIPVKIDSRLESPAYMHYYAYTQPVLLDVPIAYGRSYPIFSFGKDSVHPFVLAIREAEKSDDPKFIIQKVLENYYLRFQPESAAQFFDIQSNHILVKNPPWTVIMPWMNLSIEQWSSLQKKSVKAENFQSKSRLTINDGWAWCGPVSKEKLSIEVDRLFKVYTSIKKNGYLRNDKLDGDICANALFNESGDWVWHIQSGIHRAAVVAGLGYKHIPVRILKNIYISQVDYWPHVVSNTMDKKEAQMIFDYVFYNRLPASADSWFRYCENISTNIPDIVKKGHLVRLPL